MTQTLSDAPQSDDTKTLARLDAEAKLSSIEALQRAKWSYWLIMRIARTRAT